MGECQDRRGERAARCSDSVRLDPVVYSGDVGACRYCSIVGTFMEPSEHHARSCTGDDMCLASAALGAW